ncbi:MAG: LuxR C-terminal-related transcriptional regulator [Telluria sp.]
MIQWRTSCRELKLIHNEMDLYHAARDMALALDFEVFAFSLAIPTSLQRPSVRVYGAQQIQGLRVAASPDSLLDYPAYFSNMSMMGVDWATPGFRAGHSLGFAALPEEYTIGWSQPSRGIGAELGVSTVARTNGAITPQEIDYIEPRMLLLAQALHTQMMKILRERDEYHDQLTAGELGILRWAADGKTAHEIAKILGLGPHTTENKLRRCREKLGALTTLQAVVLAHNYGLLQVY